MRRIDHGSRQPIGIVRLLLRGRNAAGNGGTKKSVSIIAGKEVPRRQPENGDCEGAKNFQTLSAFVPFGKIRLFATWFLFHYHLHAGRTPLFGNVLDGQMRWNEYGRVAQMHWMEIPVHFPNVTLDEFVVMPDHIHGIIAITGVGAQHAAPLRTASQPDAPLRMASQPDAPLRTASQPDAPLRTASQPDAPLRTASQPDAPLRMASQPVAPLRTASQPGAPLRTASQPGAPLRMASQPDAPLRMASQPDAPLRTASQPDAPLRTASQPDAPLRMASQPDAPQPAPGSIPAIV